MLLRERPDGPRSPADRLADVRAGIGSASGAVDAIMRARRWGLQRQCELELLKAAGDTRDERLVATAVAALAEAGTDSAVAVVRSCLRHPIPRVRANAADGLRAVGVQP